MLNPSGRIDLQTLQKMANVYDKLEFIRFVGQPVFVGSSIQAGFFSDQIHANTNEMNRTVILFYNHKSSSKISNSSPFQFYCRTVPFIFLTKLLIDSSIYFSALLVHLKTIHKMRLLQISDHQLCWWPLIL